MDFVERRTYRLGYCGERVQIAAIEPCSGQTQDLSHLAFGDVPEALANPIAGIGNVPSG